MQKTNRSLLLTESAIMIALGTVLSIFKIVDLPYGGSVTIAHMLPVILIAYRHGTAWGFLTGAVYGLLQMFLGIKNLMGADLVSVIAILLLDYVVAYMATGLGGLFRRSKWSQGAALAGGAFLACAARYLCHAIAGATVWASWGVTAGAIEYSLIYNATYMIPETIVTVVAAAYIGSTLDFTGESIVRMQAKERTDAQTVLYGLGKLALAAAAIFDVQAIFARLQDAETGEFTVAEVAGAPWALMAVITAVALAAAYVCFKAANKQDLGVLSRGLWIGGVIGGAVVYGNYFIETLTKAASKAELADPMTSAGSFFGAFGALGVKYGVPVIVAGVVFVLFAVLAVRRVIRSAKAD
ncbi:MAG: energy-coupled thiamine transporter ThiT [Acutalibacteraceae bacterium]|jgi:thiamine transporter